MSVHPLAGKPAPSEILVNIPRLISAYYTHTPDPQVASERVAFGTSGHRGTSLGNSFNEAHVLATSQAIPAWMVWAMLAMAPPAAAPAAEANTWPATGPITHAGSIRAGQNVAFTPPPKARNSPSDP